MGNINRLPISDDYWKQVNKDDDPEPTECVCPFTDKPEDSIQICASNGETYPTFCAFKCAQSDIKFLQFKHKGACAKSEQIEEKL